MFDFLKKLFKPKRKMVVWFLHQGKFKVNPKFTYTRRLKLFWICCDCFPVYLADGGIVLNDKKDANGYGKPCDWLTWEYVDESELCKYLRYK